MNKSLVLPLALVFSLLATRAFAEGVGEIDLYRPTELATDGFGVGRPTDFGHLRLGARLEVDYARNPLLVAFDATGQTLAVVRNHMVGHVVGTLGLFDRLVLTFGVPVTLLMDGQMPPLSPPSPADGPGLGDVNLNARLRILGEPSDVFAFGIAAGLSLPTARLTDDLQAYRGSPGWAGRIRLLGEVRASKLLRLSADVGVQLRPQGGIDRSTLANGLLYGLDVAIPFLRDENDHDRLAMHLDVRGQIVDFAHLAYIEGHAIELAAGLKYHASSGLSVGVSGGPAFMSAIGVPDFRAVAMLAFESPSNATAAEEIVGTRPVEDPLGEDASRGQDQGDARVRDSDDDGVVDRIDRCPTVPGPPENRGCREVDTDGDGLIDRLDNCPNEAGSLENHGCMQQQLVHITDERIEISDRIFFETDRTAIRSQSFALLENIARVLLSHPDVALRVEGHTDSRGDDARNLQLSQGRAEAVVRFLVEHGVEQRRLSAIGYGEEWPIVRDASTEEQHSRNRRVEFNIVREQDLDSAPR